MRPLAVMYLAICLSGCSQQSGPSGDTASMDNSQFPAGMRKYPYLAADGGPHMLLPVANSRSWSGVSMFSPVDPNADYGRACAATENKRMAIIKVGRGSAMVFSDPPMMSWGKSADGLVELYYVFQWSDEDLDALIGKASDALPTASMTDTREVLDITEPDAFLLYAGDTPSRTAYGIHRVNLPAGKYLVRGRNIFDAKRIRDRLSATASRSELKHQNASRQKYLVVLLVAMFSG